MCLGVQFKSIQLSCSIRLPSGSLLNGRLNHAFQLSDSSLFKMEMMENEVLLSPEFEGLDDSDSERSI